MAEKKGNSGKKSWNAGGKMNLGIDKKMGRNFGEKKAGVAKAGASKAVVGKPGASKAVVGKPGGGKSGTVKPDVGESGAVKPGVGKSGAVKPGVGNSGAVKPSVGKSGAIKPGVGNSGAVKPSVGKSGAVKPGVGKSGAEKPSVENSGVGKKGDEKPSVGKSYAGKSVQEKMSGGKPDISRPIVKMYSKGKTVREKQLAETTQGKRQTDGKTTKALTTGKKEGKKTNRLCTVSRQCGGCQMLDMPYEKQLAIKQKQVDTLLKGICKVNSIIGMENPYHYRNKVHAVFGHQKGEVISGVYKAGTHILVPVETCMIEDQKADEIIGTIRGMLKSFKIRTYDEDSGYGLLRHVLVKRGFATGEIMVVLVTASPVFPSRNNFIKALREKHPEITTIIQNINDRETSMVLGDKEKTIYGKGYIEDILCNCTFRISSKSFYQINPVQTEILYTKAIEAAGLTGKETVIDAYCGIGTIGIIASKYAGKVIGVELNKDAVRDAVENAKRNEIKNIQFYNNDAGKFMVGMAAQGEKADVVFMDPPRSGSTEEFIDSVAIMAPKRVVYVSCNPETLVRDLGYFRKKGYEAKVGWAVDLFPMTPHVETVVSLTRKNGGLKPTYHIELEIPMEVEGENDEIKYRSKERQATYPKIKEYIKDKFGVNVHTQDIAEIKSLCGLEKRPNYNKSKKAEPKIRHCVPEKAEYIKSALNHYGLI